MKTDIRGWVAEYKGKYAQSGWNVLPVAIYYAYLGLWYSLSSRVTFGKRIYDNHWDVMIVLDACRLDALKQIAPEYSFINDIRAVTSMGTSSEGWIANNFTMRYEQQINKTTLISANGYTEGLFLKKKDPPTRRSVPISIPNWNVVSASDFNRLDEVWRYGRNSRLNQVPPRVLTDNTVATHRSESPEKLIVHYLQPHSPYIARPIWENREPTYEELHPGEAYDEGTLTRSELWGLYLDNLRLVLDEIRVLKQNMDAERVILTADHGELLGELGIHGHPSGMPHPKLLRVPWVKFSATDEKTHRPDSIDRTEEDDIENHLQALGYL